MCVGGSLPSLLSSQELPCIVKDATAGAYANSGCLQIYLGVSYQAHCCPSRVMWEGASVHYSKDCATLPPGPKDLLAWDAKRYCERSVGRLSTALAASSVCRMSSLLQIHSADITVKVVLKEDPGILAAGPGSLW